MYIRRYLLISSVLKIKTRTKTKNKHITQERKQKGKQNFIIYTQKPKINE
ncbi:hypothetical protein DOY81_000054, partial [Sarcophaga bullata]